MTQFSMQVTLAYEASDESDATQKATELSALLCEAGYGHISTVVIDSDGLVAEFGMTGLDS